MIPPNHTGFRKGIGTIDNIYVLNYIINKRLGRIGEEKREGSSNARI